jgi:hypothetical protein
VHEAFWWENKERWFLNWAVYQGKDRYTKSTWITAKDAPQRIERLLREEKELYLDKKE